MTRPPSDHAKRRRSSAGRQSGGERSQPKPRSPAIAAYDAIQASRSGSAAPSRRDRVLAAAARGRCTRGRRRNASLAGVPYAAKDNIDVAGTAHHSRLPRLRLRRPKPRRHVVSAPARRGGRLSMGKTNLDQFATGLVGVRSPYGVPRNCLSIAPMSAAGRAQASAVAVRRRASCPSRSAPTPPARADVPAAFNHLIGFKPTKGRWTTSRYRPRLPDSVDCVTVFDPRYGRRRPGGSA